MSDACEAFACIVCAEMLLSLNMLTIRETYLPLKTSYAPSLISLQRPTIGVACECDVWNHRRHRSDGEVLVASLSAQCWGMGQMVDLRYACLWKRIGNQAMLATPMTRSFRGLNNVS